jgi:hypothetical protein
MKAVIIPGTHSIFSKVSLVDVRTAFIFVRAELHLLTLYLLSDPQGQQVRRGPSSLTEFEVSLADMCVSSYVPFRLKMLMLITLIGIKAQASMYVH